MMNNRIKKKEFPWWLVGVIVCILVIIFMVYKALWGSVIFVGTKTNFSSYEEFRNYVPLDFFQDELPESASNISYYYFKGHFDEYMAVACDLNDEDYKEIQEYYKEWFNKKNWETDIENGPIPDILYESENLNFLEDMAGEDLQDMQMLEYWDGGASDNLQVMGIMGDADTGRVVIFNGDDEFFHNSPLSGNAVSESLESIE